MVDPLVSVVLPVRDGAATIGAAVRSVLEQSFAALQLVVVDDGSGDDSADRALAAAGADPRLCLVRQPACGLVAALNRGVEAAAPSARWIARMDADDISHAARLERQIVLLEADPTLAAVSCRVEPLGAALGDGWRRYLAWLNAQISADEIARALCVESPLAHPSVTMRCDALAAVGGYRDFDGPEDYDLWLRLARAGGRFAKVDEVLFAWRDHESRLTRSDARYRVEAFTRLKATHLARSALAPGGAGHGRPLIVWGAGRMGRQLARALESEGQRIEAFVDIDPKKIGRTRRGRPVLAPEALAERGAAFVVAAVPVVGARALIREALDGMGRSELADYVMCG